MRSYFVLDLFSSLGNCELQYSCEVDSCIRKVYLVFILQLTSQNMSNMYIMDDYIDITFLCNNFSEVQVPASAITSIE